MAQGPNPDSTRERALARRRAMSTGGKASLGAAAKQPTKPTRAAPPSPAPKAAEPTRRAPARQVASPAVDRDSTRAKSLARRKSMSTRGKSANNSKDRTRIAPEKVVADVSAVKEAGKSDCGCGCKGEKKAARAERPRSNGSSSRNKRPSKARSNLASNPAKAASLARRKAMSTRGKAGLSSSGMSEAQTARAANPQLSGRELAKTLREQRSRRGSSGKKAPRPTGRQRKAADTNVGAASDQPWKVGASETAHGQTVTGTMVGRDKDVTGDEASTCRAVTGTEYLGADIFRDFCQAEPAATPRRGGVSPTGRGNAVTGNKVGRSNQVTGDEPGTCKNVTGTEYVGADQGAAFCGTSPKASPAKVSRTETIKGKSVTGNNVGRSGKVTGDEPGSDRHLTGTQYMQLGEDSAPNKVGQSATLRGGNVSGTMVGRRDKMTGDEAGSCRNVTGDDYVGQEQFGTFCESTPKPADQKVGVSGTQGGEAITGTMTGRSERVTGDEPGTCKAVTGTPYAGAEQYAAYCEPNQSKAAAARMSPAKRNQGMPMTGIQPGIGGPMTGADKGACETVSGTPYIGVDQAARSCAATASEPGSPDFPQPLDGAAWGDFSVAPPAHAAQVEAPASTVTGAVSDAPGHITGPFGMADGKVTGTEHARFGKAISSLPVVDETATEIDGRVKSRVTGEGQDAGLKVTGDDWERGDRVTGTEGASALVRNPTRQGQPVGAMAFKAAAENAAPVPAPVSRVTGSSGNYENGSLITFSGGARG